MKNTKIAEKAQTKGREPHALDDIKIIEGKREWSQVVSEWYQPMDFDSRIAWLQKNQVRMGNGPEQFIFYLELADRHGDNSIFSDLPDSDNHLFCLKSYLSIGHMKKLISKKAYSILCSTFFRKYDSFNEEEWKNVPFPIILPYEDPLFSKLLWFFRPYGGYGGFDNLRPANTEGLAKGNCEHYLSNVNNFAKDFARNAWKMLNGRWDWPDCRPKKIVIAKDHFEEIILLLRHFDLLNLIECDYHYSPDPLVYKWMVEMALKENNIGCNPKIWDNMEMVDRVLRPLVQRGQPFARALYLCRLNYK